ncbi:substrate-binding domain-containing protein [Methylophaga pinxianii]|uniref:substrate-binding domain-containing protein n=1 Tax=Methylophaga pinxianii TaxID=2881052 RepID=UPI001CF12E5E|nr:substrate-binding domain-containing protein [Methylophaga pinxianii]MCB2427930.1 substrate-binding domain-containing protein [Methylophaga pinxianii]UPH44421.1 substrate-binding domain-containing protein [Methylophaga pinxianii]
MKRMLGVTIWLVLALSSFSPVLKAEVVIVNPKLVDLELSQTTLRAIFAMRIPQWPDGTPINVFVLDDQDPLHIHFCKSLLGMLPYQLRRIWDQQAFSGTGVKPNLVNSETEMRQRVATTPGAIGYISNSKIDNTVTALGAS